MRKIFLVILMTFTAGYVIAQFGKVTGTVVDSESGKPVPMVTVSIGDSKTTTDDKGNFELDNIPAGKCMISFSSESFELLTMEISLLDGENNLLY
jgi:uncharacterized membrane protein